MVDVLAVLRERMTDPSSRGLVAAVTEAMREGLLIEGDRLPPVRRTADALHLSPTTVSSAWALLRAAGAIATDGRRGTTVAAPTRRFPQRYRAALDRHSSFDLDLSTGLPDSRLLPRLAPALRRLPASFAPGSYLDEPVLPALREAVLADWPYPVEALTIADGAMDAIDQICGALLSLGRRVAVETPSFPPLLDLLEFRGLELVPVRVDDEGPVTEDLAAALGRGVEALFLQPRAHNPAGSALTHRRIAALGDLLAPTSIVIVEDDSAGAIAATAGISLGSRLPARTVHVRSFSKSHGPDLRLAAIGGSAEIIGLLDERRLLGQAWTSRLLQSLLLDLLSEPVPMAEVAAAREAYARRRSALVAALRLAGVTVAGVDGINLWVPVLDETAAVVRLASRGIGVAAGAPFQFAAAAQPHIRVTCGLLERDVERVAAELADAATRTGLPRAR